MVHLKNKLIVILISSIFLSCKSEHKKELFITWKKNGETNEIILDTVSSSLEVFFNKKSPFTKQYYNFDEYGTLIEKRGLNFFGEEEVYLFDINNSLSEFRKIVQFNNKKRSLQEFIRYNNGIIDSEKSHYFDFEILDSINNNYLIKLSYLGGLKVKELNVSIADFSRNTEDLIFNKSFQYFDSTIIFLADKKKVLDDEIGFFQLNIHAKFYNFPNLIKPINKGNMKPIFEQNIILRRLKNKIKGFKV